jgi:hypothetical protein
MSARNWSKRSGGFHHSLSDVLSIESPATAAGGALTVLTKYNVPQVNQTIFGGNPYAIKRDAIEGTMNWLFSGIALIGVFIQAVAYVVNLPDRSPSTSAPTYAMVFAVSASVVIILLWLTTCVGYAIARRQWLPTIVEGQLDLFHLTEMLIRNDGLEDRHMALPADDPQREPLIIDGRRRIGEYLTQMEDLLDIAKRTGTQPERLDRLRRAFGPSTDVR